MGWDLKFKALIEGDLRFRHSLVRSEPEAFLLESQTHQGIPSRYNVSFPRRQAIPDAQSES
jgi:hypothetical protein